MFLEAPADWVSKVYLSDRLSGDAEILARLERESLLWETVEDRIFRSISDTQTPQGVLTVLKTPAWQPEQLLSRQKDPLLVVLEDLQDPGNAGTIFRTAEAAGVSLVLLTRTCVDVTSPKVIRSTMGGIYRLPFAYVEDVREARELLGGFGVRLAAAHLQGENNYDEEDYRGGTAFLIGNEGKGLTEEASALADIKVKIPMCGKVESLNAAMAAGILLYEAYRQRRRNVL